MFLSNSVDMMKNLPVLSPIGTGSTLRERHLKMYSENREPCVSLFYKASSSVSDAKICVNIFEIIFSTGAASA